MLSLPNRWQIRGNAVLRDLSNFSLFHHRDVDGALVSMHQSGTHWLKYMLATALSKKHGVAPPRYNHANDIIGGPGDSRPPPPLPRLVASHSVPHALIALPVFRGLLGLPPYVVLIRDLRASLVSNYGKWRQRYAVSFDEYLRGDPSEQRYNSDLWWCLRFLNGWGRVAVRCPDTTLVVRYEDLLVDTAKQLDRISAFLQLDLSAMQCSAAISAASREQMALRHDPTRPEGEVSLESPDLKDYFGAHQRRYLALVCEKYLRYPLGYDYSV